MTGTHPLDLNDEAAVAARIDGAAAGHDGIVLPGAS
jgi:hypothetical protein